MSEFRKYRLVTKLLDLLGIVEAPQRYVAMLNDSSPVSNKFSTSPVLHKFWFPKLNTFRLKKLSSANLNISSESG